MPAILNSIIIILEQENHFGSYNACLAEKIFYIHALELVNVLPYTLKLVCLIREKGATIGRALNRIIAAAVLLRSQWMHDAMRCG